VNNEKGWHMGIAGKSTILFSDPGFELWLDDLLQLAAGLEQQVEVLAQRSMKK
jgi:hypothetical protein